jgi:mannose/fructose/N-acetylgalactosamine-specific phosphotransferase system component IIC
MELIYVSLAVGFLGLDSTAAFQTMISRPLVTGFVTGFLLGDMVTGLAIGCLIELIWVGLVPVGSVVVPEFGLGAAVASAGTIFFMRENQFGVSVEAVSVWMLLLGLVFAYLGGLVEIAVRRFHAVLARWVDGRLEKGDESSLAKAVVFSLILIFAKGFVLSLLGLVFFIPVISQSLSHLPVGILTGLGWAYWFLLMLGLVVIVDLYWERQYLPYLALSFLCGFVLLYGFKIPVFFLIPIFFMFAFLILLFEKRKFLRLA